ncbi:MAG TPA: patatin-like phospholipase family protein [Clostridiales bacterium]|nr:patatin-like phospholipase family protein [Clostridiales bacterium]
MGDSLAYQIKNMVFEGGGILGTSYLGVLDYLYRRGRIGGLQRLAGTSAGAITACIMSFNLPFEQIESIAASLDYKKIPEKTEINELKLIPEEVKAGLDELFGDINCIYRLLHDYGWFSTEYFYSWIQRVIADQFDIRKKHPPYTFTDFKNPYLHKENRPFYDLYIIGTDLSMKTSRVFSYETTPLMEVATAVRISMSIPLFFEAVKLQKEAANGTSMNTVFCDGGLLNNYPLNLFDTPKFNLDPYYGVNMETLGVRFMQQLNYKEIDCLLTYIESLLHAASYIQQGIYDSNPLNKERSIVVDTQGISPVDFDVTAYDEKYWFLYMQGYKAAKKYFGA